jgi:hypothetical protein
MFPEIPDFGLPPGLEDMLPPFVWDATTDLERAINDDHIMYLAVNALCALRIPIKNNKLFDTAKFFIDEGYINVILDTDNKDIELLILIPAPRR